MEEITQKVSDDRTILLFGKINKDSAKDVISQLLSLNKTPGPIKLIVSSKGGCADSGFAIVDIMKSLSCVVETYCLGECESAAASIVASGTKGKRYCFPLGEMMIHSPFGEDICGDWEKVKSQSKSMKNAHEKVINILCAATGKKRKTIENDMKKEPYMSAEEAVKYGLVDHIFEGKF